MENTTLLSDIKCLNSCLDLPGCVTGEMCKRYIENVYIFPNFVEWIYIGLYIILFCSGLIGNTLVCYVIYTCHHMQTFVNMFIFNLAVADFLVILVCLPSTMMADVTETWYLGETMCKVVPFLQTTSVTVSVLTLSAISVERYFAICKPWTRRLSRRFILRIIIAIWFIGIVVSIPDLVYYSVTTTFQESVTFYLRYCSRRWTVRDNMIYNLVILIVLYSIPICLMAYTYAIISKQLWRKDLPGIVEAEHRPMNKMVSSGPESQLRSRQRAAKMLIAIVVVFAVCYLPVHVLNLTRYTASFGEIPAKWISIIVLTSHILCYANSVVNPFIYNFMSAKFRKEFQSVLRLSRCKCTSKKIRVPSVMTSSKNKSSLPRTERYEMNTVSSKQSWSKASSIRKAQNPQEKYG
ncbi:orexin receptor type 2-like [Ostrea edulis]|uniref:orexin receptor type 2-like n=1 Tax=Ostrea edulis TaxID=37623 RepID=UPI002094EE42|nr:orexin receptor type 2-like [Ostrea edulis]